MTDPTKPTVQEADVAALIGRAKWVGGMTAHHDTAQIMPASMSHGKASDICRQALPLLLSLASALERAQADTARLELAIVRALGYVGEFPEPPDDIPGKPKRRYWWRSWLREIAGLTHERCEQVAAAMSRSSSAT